MKDRKREMLGEIRRKYKKIRDKRYSTEVQYRTVVNPRTTKNQDWQHLEKCYLWKINTGEYFLFHVATRRQQPPLYVE